MLRHASSSAKWYDRRDSVEQTAKMLVNFDRQNVVSVVSEDRINVKHENEMDIFEAIDENESKHKCKTRLRHGGGKNKGEG